MRAAVVALGDLGRSARMRYHAQALAAHGVDVDLVGFEGTPLPRAITDDPRITRPSRCRRRMLRHGAPELELRARRRLSTRRGIGFRLWRTLRRLPQPDLVLVQNPPAFPTLTVTRFSLAPPRRALRHRLAQPRLHAAAAAPRAMASGRAAARAGSSAATRGGVDANLCVSRGLAAFLKSRFGVQQRARALRPAGVDLRADRARRPRALSARRC